MCLDNGFLRVIERVDIFPKVIGKYSSFPTLAKSSGRIFLAFREGIVDRSVPHGRDGKVRLFESSDALHWHEFSIPFRDSELDAIISGPFERDMFLWTRSFEYEVRNDVYISKFGVGKAPISRKKLEISGADIVPFSHIRYLDGELFAPAYGMVDGIASPVILHSIDFGDSWHIRSLITPDGFSPELNETSILQLEDGFAAIMRSKEPSFSLYYSFSKDAVDWSNPERMDIIGHAPMLLRAKSGRFVLVFRDLMGSLPGIGIAISDDFKKWKCERIDFYTGDIYDGGYADIIELERDEFFVVYYLADEDASPWIRGAFLKIF